MLKGNTPELDGHLRVRVLFLVKRRASLVELPDRPFEATVGGRSLPGPCNYWRRRGDY